MNLNNKGITLIALVITVIIIIILAGIGISSIRGNNGIINKTKEARSETNKAEAEEAVNLAVITATSLGRGELTYENLVSQLNKEIGEGKYTITPESEAEKWTVTVPNEYGDIIIEVEGEEPTPVQPAKQTWSWKVERQTVTNGTEEYALGNIITGKDGKTYYVLGIKNSQLLLEGTETTSTTYTTGMSESDINNVCANKFTPIGNGSVKALSLREIADVLGVTINESNGNTIFLKQNETEVTGDDVNYKNRLVYNTETGNKSTYASLETSVTSNILGQNSICVAYNSDIYKHTIFASTVNGWGWFQKETPTNNASITITPVYIVGNDVQIADGKIK